MNPAVKWYAVLLGITLLILWVFWPVLPGTQDTEFEQACNDKAGDVAELTDGGGLICVRNRKVVLRENPLPRTREA